MNPVRMPLEKCPRIVTRRHAAALAAVALTLMLPGTSKAGVEVKPLKFEPRCFTPGSTGNRVTLEATNNSSSAADPLIIFQLKGPWDPPFSSAGIGVRWDVPATETLLQSSPQPPLTQIGTLDYGKTIRATGLQSWPAHTTLRPSFFYTLSPTFTQFPAEFKYVVYVHGGSPLEQTAQLDLCPPTSPEPDFRIYKEANLVGGNLVGYTIKVQNAGAKSTGELTVQDLIPGKLTITRASWGRSHGGGFGNLIANGQKVLYKSSVPFDPKELLIIRVQVQPDAGESGEVSNFATVCGGGDPTAPCTSPRGSNVVKVTLPKPVGPAPPSQFNCPVDARAGTPAECQPQQAVQAIQTAAAAAPIYAWFLEDEPQLPAAVGPRLVHTFATDGKQTVSLVAFGNGTRSTTHLELNVQNAAPGCTANATTLCLLGGRFKVQADWQALNNATNGAANTRVLTSDTGAFWFFDAANLELIVKVIDGRGLNGKFWVFFGALSDVQYQIKVTDTQTGQIREYLNDQGDLSSVADTSAFPVAASAADDGWTYVATTLDDSLDSWAIAAPATACIADPGTKKLCLSDRFDVSVTCAAQGVPCTPNPVKLTSDTGYFWFFNSANIELMTKVVDGRGLNGTFWFFYGALSNVQYKIRLTDRQTGKFKEYTNPQGTLASVADTSALTP